MEKAAVVYLEVKSNSRGYSLGSAREHLDHDAAWRVPQVHLRGQGGTNLTLLSCNSSCITSQVTSSYLQFRNFFELDMKFKYFLLGNDLHSDLFRTQLSSEQKMSTTSGERS